MDEEKTGFIRERIKKKPVEKKVYVVRTGLVVLLGVLFGLVAAVSYTAGVYHLERNVYREPAREVVLEARDDGDVTPASAGDAETGPDGSDSGADISGSEADPEGELKPGPSEPGMKHSSLAEIEAFYSSLYEVADAAAESLLPVYAVKADQGWFTTAEESSKQGSGLVIADNRRELLILVDRNVIAGADRIRVMLPDGSSVPASEKKYDSNINLSIIGVELTEISDKARSLIKPAELGASGSRLLGKNVIAVGSPLGISESLSYGVVTSVGRTLQKPDTDVHLITTDIYGSVNGSGILVNLKGQTVGIITQDGADPAVRNLINAYGISDIKDSIERMSNGQDKAYLGVYATDVTSEAAESLHIPTGAYVTDMEVDSVAMDCGIKTGDVITMVGTNPVRSFEDFKTAINNAHPGDETVITVQRSAMGGYSEMTFDVTFGTLK